MIIRMHVDEGLDSLKRTYHSLDSYLSQYGQRLNIEVDFSIHYFPQLGFLIRLDSYLQGYELQFRGNNGECYYKCDQVRVLDEQIGDIHTLIRDFEIEIMQEIRDLVMAERALILSMCESMAIVDCLLTFAKVAQDHNYVKPNMTHQDCLVLENSRHPLLEQTTAHFITNSIQLGCFNDLDRPKTMAITGPNSSGKSVFLHQVGLITFMAHIGSYVPCTKATIGITPKLLTKLTSSSSSSSSFLLDLQQAAHTVTQSEERCLVILDEFGKGTQPADGISLFSAVLLNLMSSKAKVLASTHFHEMFRLKVLEKLPVYTMRVDKVFMFELVKGVGAVSLGVDCAERAGLDKKVVERAREIAGKWERGESLTIVQERLNLAKMVVSLFMGLTWHSPDLERDLISKVRPIMHLL